MRKIKEALRLHFEAGMSERQIAGACGVGKGTVRRYLKRARAAQLPWPLPEDIDDARLEKMLFPPPPPPSAGKKTDAGLWSDPQGTEESERHITAALGGIQREFANRI